MAFWEMDNAFVVYFCHLNIHSIRAVADLIDHDGDFGDEQRGEDGREHPERKLHGRGGYR